MNINTSFHKSILSLLRYMISQCVYDPKRSKVNGTCGETLAQLMSVDLLVIRNFRIILAR